MPSSLNRVRKPGRWAEQGATPPLHFAGIAPVVIGQSTLFISVGNLVDSSAEGLVCYASSSLALHSVVASKLVEVGGATIRSECAKHVPAEIGKAVVLSGGKLPARYILIGVTNHIKSAPTVATIRASVQSVLERAAKLGLTSIALPAIRVSKQVSPDDALLATLAPIVDHISGPTTLKEVMLIIDDLEDFPLLAQYLPACISRLHDLARLRASARALRPAEEVLRHSEKLALNTSWSPKEVLAGILQQQLLMYQQVLALLHTQQQETGSRWQASYLVEIQLTNAEIERITTIQQTLELHTSSPLVAVNADGVEL